MGATKKKRMSFTKHCGAKRQYETRGYAAEALDAMLTDEDFQISKKARATLIVYRCDYMDHWHIGRRK